MMDRLIAFGDIHGMALPAKAAVDLAEQLEAKAVFLGDYVDRGLESMETLKILARAKETHPDWVFLRGNHDQMLLELISGRKKETDIGVLFNGGMYAYQQSSDAYRQWLYADVDVQQTTQHFLKELTPYYETLKLIFLHGVLNGSRKKITDFPEEELRWNYEYRPKWKGKPFVHGHLPVNEVEFRLKGVNINTACGYENGYLAGLLLENDSLEKHQVFKIDYDGNWTRSEVVSNP